MFTFVLRIIFIIRLIVMNHILWLNTYKLYRSEIILMWIQAVWYIYPSFVFFNYYFVRPSYTLTFSATKWCCFTKPILLCCSFSAHASRIHCITASSHHHSKLQQYLYLLRKGWHWRLLPKIPNQPLHTDNLSISVTTVYVYVQHPNPCLLAVAIATVMY